MSAVNIAIIGCGRISGHHCRSILKTPDTNLVAVCDLDADKANEYARTYNVKAYTNYRKMLADFPEITVVAIVTPSGMHYEHGMEILGEFKKSLIVEKPTFMRPSQLKEIYALSKDLNLNIFPIFQNRHNLAVQRVRQGVLNGELGKIRTVSVRVRWCRPQKYYDLAPWRGTYSMDGGCLTNQGVHHIDLMRYFAGPVLSVSAIMRTVGSDIEVEDAMVGNAIFQSGAIGNLEVTTAARPIDYEASISLVCENGLAQIGGIAVNELQIYTPAPEACEFNSEDFSGNIYGHGHELIYRKIADFFLKGIPYSVSEEDALETIKLLNAFYVSDEKGSAVEVNSAGDSHRLGKAEESLAKLYRT